MRRTLRSQYCSYTCTTWTNWSWDTEEQLRLVKKGGDENVNGFFQIFQRKHGFDFGNVRSNVGICCKNKLLYSIRDAFGPKKRASVLSDIQSLISCLSCKRDYSVHLIWRNNTAEYRLPLSDWLRNEGRACAGRKEWDRGLNPEAHHTNTTSVQQTLCVQIHLFSSLSSVLSFLNRVRVKLFTRSLWTRP